MTFKALRIQQHADGTIGAGWQQMSAVELTPGDVLIRVIWSGINYKDALAATGASRILRRYPLNGGVDLAGVVEQSSVAEYQPGQSVVVTGSGLSETLDGGYSEYARVPASAVIPLPDSLSLRDAMILGTAGFTAALAIHQLEHNGLVPNTLPVAVTGATGGVGSMAINMLHARGHRVAAITGKASERDYLQQLGADEIWLRQDIALKHAPLDSVRIAAGIDNLGGEWLDWLLCSTAPQGSVVSIGLASGAQLNTTVMPFILRGVNLLGVTSANTPRVVRERIWQRLATDLKPPALESICTRVIEFDELPAAFPDYLQGNIRGRTLVRIGNQP